MVVGEVDQPRIEPLQGPDPVRDAGQRLTVAARRACQASRSEAYWVAPSWLCPATITVPSARRTTSDWWLAV